MMPGWKRADARWPRHALLSVWPALLVLAVSLALTAWAWHRTKIEVETSARTQFESTTLGITKSIHGRMLAYEEILRGGAALFAASSAVAREDWSKYVDQLELPRAYPGMMAMGFAEHGKDMAANPVMRTAMEHARDSGGPALTSRVVFAQPSASRPQAGFLLYLPVYRNDAPLATVAERRAAIRGYVYGEFRAQDLMRDVMRHRPEDLSLEVYDGAQPSAQTLLFANLPVWSQQPAFSITRQVAIAEHPWTLKFHSGPYAQAVEDADQPVIVLAAGIPISLLFFAIAWSQSTLRTRAQSLANEMMTARLKAESEKQRLEASLRQAQRLEAMGTLAGGIAHDFNNILGAILGYGELAQNAAPAEGPLRRYLDNINSAGLRAKSLVERILAFSRAGLGERVPVHVQSVVAEALDLFSASLPAAVRLERTLNAGDAAIVGDPTQIHQVVMNLCTNAQQAVKSGGTVTVSLDLITLNEQRAVATTALPAGEFVRLIVQDSGHGIEPQVIERIFDPFFTTKEVGVGTGLGLSLVHGIVSDLGGGVDVQSEIGRGSTFTVWLPRQGVAADSKPAEQERLPLGAGETILLVDDEEPLVQLGEEMIAELGYEPVGFTSSAAALAAFRADPKRFDAVLSDETMPGMTGSQLTQEIRKLRADIPVVLMSGYGGPVLAARARAAGANDVLGKPLISRDIARSLASVLRK